MRRIEPTSRYGRTSVRNAELPANPAAIMNGKSGRQQLEAATTLPIAARLAATVSALLNDSVRVLADIASLGMCFPAIATTIQKCASISSYLADHISTFAPCPNRNHFRASLRATSRAMAILLFGRS